MHSDNDFIPFLTSGSSSDFLERQHTWYAMCSLPNICKRQLRTWAIICMFPRDIMWAQCAGGKILISQKRIWSLARSTMVLCCPFLLGSPSLNSGEQIELCALIAELVQSFVILNVMLANDAVSKTDRRALLQGAVNFRDVMIASGKVSRDRISLQRSDHLVGFEFSGTKVNRVLSSMMPV